MNTQPPCPDPPLPLPRPLFCGSRFHAPPENSLTLPGTPASTTPPNLPLPRPWLLMREAEAWGLRIYFAILNFQRENRAPGSPLSWARLPQMEPRPHQPAPRTLRPPQDPPFHHPPAPFLRASGFISRF